MNNDLIERLRAFIKAYEDELSEDPYGRSLIEQAIAALSPVLPEDVGYDPAKCTHSRDKQADMLVLVDCCPICQQTEIERLAREGKAAQFHADENEKEIHHLQQRIEELKDACKMWARQRDNEMLKATACEAQIVELQQRIEELKAEKIPLYSETKLKAQIAEYEKALDKVIDNCEDPQAVEMIARTELERIWGMK